MKRFPGRSRERRMQLVGRRVRSIWACRVEIRRPAKSESLLASPNRTAPICFLTDYTSLTLHWWTNGKFAGNQWRVAKSSVAHSIAQFMLASVQNVPVAKLGTVLRHALNPCQIQTFAHRIAAQNRLHRDNLNGGKAAAPFEYQVESARCPV